MKILRLLTVMLFIAASCVFGWYYIQEKSNTDLTVPTIQMDEPLIQVSIHDDEKALLQGLTAYDEKDGDLTHKIIVESISQFVDKDTCTVTYAVADGDKHVAKCTRKVQYIDYEKPQFYLKQPMVFDVGDGVAVDKFVGAVDCIEGDISDRVIITATDYQAGAAGVYSMSLLVTNSKGDIAYLDISLFVEGMDIRAPEIELTDYLIYVKQGQELDFNSYVKDVYSLYNNIDRESFLISGAYDPNTPGVYHIHYYVEDIQGNDEHTVLTVVVEE